MNGLLTIISVSVSQYIYCQMDCPFCNTGPLVEGHSNVAKIKTEKGRDSVNNASDIRSLPNVKVEIGALVHENCRAKHINKKSLDLIIRGKTPSSPFVTKTRSSTEVKFDFKTHCLYCQKLIIKNSKQSKQPKLDEPYSKVSTLNFDKTLKEDIARRNDEWAAVVNETLSYAVADLFASDAIFHRDCQMCFKAGQEKPSEEWMTKVGDL